MYRKTGSGQYLINDDKAILVYDMLYKNSADIAVTSILKEKDLWGIDLGRVTGFSEMIQHYLQLLQKCKSQLN